MEATQSVTEILQLVASLLQTRESVLLALALILFVCLVVIRATDQYMKALDASAQFNDMLNDLECLLSIEDLHCRNNKEFHGMSMRFKIRKYVHTERGQVLSGQYTRSGIAKRRRREEALRDKWLKPLGKISIMALLRKLA